MGGTTSNEHRVVIAGGGPTGLVLAAELALAEVDVVVAEQRGHDEDLDRARAGGLHARTLELLDQRGVVERFLAEGQVHPAVGFAYTPLDISDLPSRHPYLLALPQRETERLLAGWVDELGVPVHRGRGVSGFRADDDGVDVELADGSTVRAAYLVGCDGGRSLVRRAAGIDFPGLDPTASWIMAEVEVTATPPLGTRPEGGGIGPAPRDGGAPAYGIVVREPRLGRDRSPTLDDLREALLAVYGTDFGAHAPTRLSRFTDGARQAATYRAGRVLLAGDAAHVHPPQGGQGLNTGVQDAFNLGWKLARAVTGSAPVGLLDTYHDERHPVGARVLDVTSAQVALATPGERHDALRRTVADLLALEEPRRRTGARMAGLDVRYDLGDGHPLLGRRMPDLDLRVDGEPTRVAELLRAARPVLLVLDGGSPDGPVGAPAVDVVAATAAERAELPAIGPVDVPPAVLIRPDGHVAWTGSSDDPELPAAAARWCGSAAAA